MFYNLTQTRKSTKWEGEEEEGKWWKGMYDI